MNTTPQSTITNISSDGRIIAIVANYDFSDNADRLKAQLAPHFPTLLFDNSSPVTPRTADRVLPNHYFSGQWNAAVKEALDRACGWLLFVASDVQILSAPAFLAACVNEAIDDPRVGIYTPSLHHDSRALYPACFNFGTGSTRQCYLTELFFFLARTEILKALYPVDGDKYPYGWGLGAMSAYEAHRQALQVVVDDRVQIFHPKAVHETPHPEALRQMRSMITPSPVLRFYRQARRRAKRAHKWYTLRSRLRGAFSRIVR